MTTNATNLIATIDWLEFTFKSMDLNQLIIDVLGLHLSDFTDLKKGRFGYNAQKTWSHGSLFLLYNYDPIKSTKDKIAPITDDRMGIHVIITGSACRHYESRKSLAELINLLVAAGDDCNFSRIDLAIDDKEDSVINYNKISKAATNRSFTSRWNKWDEVNSRQCSTGDFLGRTMYFGSQSSEIFCRIYDKSLERKANSDAKDIPEHWTRLELVYRKERAKLLALHLVDHADIGTVIRETLNNYIRFVQKPRNSSDTNKSRWKSASWWDRLLGHVGKLILTIKRKEKTIADMEDWIDSQISPTLATIITAKDGDVDWLHKIISDGAARLKQKHKDAIAQYKGLEA